MSDYMPDDEDYAQLRYLYEEDWLNSERRAGRYHDPERDLSEILPLLPLGEKPDPSEARPSLGEEPEAQLPLASNEVHISEMDMRYIVSVAQARWEYKQEHWQQLDQYLQEHCPSLDIERTDEEE